MVGRLQYIREWLILFAYAAGVMLRLAGWSLWPFRKGRFRFRRWVMSLVFLPVLLLLQMLHWLCLLLDELCFPRYHAVAVRAPVFIVGVPRSGTTFLHRVLAEDRGTFTTFRMWELILAPSILQKKGLLLAARLDRRLGSPMGRILRRVEGRLLGTMDDIHRLSLQAPEEDFLLLLPVMHCFALVVAFPESESLWRIARFDVDVPDRRRRRVMAFYRSCVQRHLLVLGRGRRLLSKNVSFVPFLQSLRDTFPDARMVVCYRDPRKVVPSQLSSLRPGLRLFGHSAAADGFSRRIVDMLVFYYDRIISVRGRQRRGEGVVVIHMRDLQRHLYRVVRRIYGFLDLSMEPAVVAKVKQMDRNAAVYRSGHRYSLEEFGWTEESIAAIFNGSERRAAACVETFSDA